MIVRYIIDQVVIDWIISLTRASSRSSFLLASIVSSIRLSNILLTFSYKPRRSAKLCIKMLLISLRNATDALRSRSAFAILLVEKASHSSTVEELQTI